MDTIINIETSNIEVINSPDIIINTLQPNETLITILDSNLTELTFTDIGVQGIKGAQGFGLNYQWSDTNLGIKREDENVFVYQNLKGATGDPLEFEDLTEQQKQELRGDVGDTSTNYTNIFLNSLLS